MAGRDGMMMAMGMMFMSTLTRARFPEVTE